ncbi:MAG: Fpg/Nei family DNA glycosylase [Akkermansiaceae bacterium]|nr:Fpg/Nei family DNA glycosylase [Akkermansiaceae bacterium]
MPELAEVELARRSWSAATGQVVRAVASHPRTRIFRDCPARTIARRLTGATFTGSRAHGKRLLFSFAAAGAPARKRRRDVLHLELHLGMAGRLFADGPAYAPDKHDHLVLGLTEAALVFSDYRQFGRLAIHDDADPWAHLPPQVLDPAFTLRHLTAILDRHPNKNLKGLLLDQAFFPGIGNWMADEVCWRLGVFPGVAARRLDPAALRRVARQVCRGALHHVADKNHARNGADGFAPGSYVHRVPPRAWLFQHRWKPGGACPRCRTGLSRATVASRTTAWCPACQPPM